MQSIRADTLATAHKLGAVCRSVPENLRGDPRQFVDKVT
jgi:hypothetical protein